MEIKNLACDSCTIKGYSFEICKKHLEHMDHEKSSAKKTGLGSRMKSLAGKAAVGAGIGVAVYFAGLALAPAIGAKALLGHFLVAKVTYAGAAGVGAGVALDKIKKQNARSLPKAEKLHSLNRSTKFQMAK
jgi:hypothetical protein